MTFIDQNISLEKCPALVLNADYRPLSYYPLSLWSWQDSIKSFFLDNLRFGPHPKSFNTLKKLLSKF